MKLVRSMSGSALAAMSLAALLACASGCSATTSQAPRTASLSNVAGTTSLMSAEISGPAPKVGKSHLAVDEADSDVDGTIADESAPKEARRSDGSRRGGGFGTSSK